MSNHEKFEEVVLGQLPPDSWYAFDLDEQVPHLDPHSVLGGVVIELYEKFADTDSETWDELQSLVNLQEEDESAQLRIAELEGRVEETEIEVELFFHLYDRVAELLEIMQPITAKADLYEIAVIAGCDATEVQVRSSAYYRANPEAREAALSRITEWGLLYRMESNRHFQAIQQDL